MIYANIDSVMSSPLQDWFQCMFSRITDSLKLSFLFKKRTKNKKRIPQSFNEVNICYITLKVCVCMSIYWKCGNSLGGLIRAFYWIKQSSKTIGSKTRLPLARVQLQQPGIHPEEMDGVSERNEIVSQFSMHCFFISSVRFSSILLQKH